MRRLLTGIAHRLDATGPRHAAAILALLWLLTIAAAWVAAKGAV